MWRDQLVEHVKQTEQLRIRAEHEGRLEDEWALWEYGKPVAMFMGPLWLLEGIELDLDTALEERDWLKMAKANHRLFQLLDRFGVYERRARAGQEGVG